MEKNNYPEERFDSFLNKTIILSSKDYYKRKMNIIDKEKTIVDNDDFSSFLQNFVEQNNQFLSIDNIDKSMELKTALNCLSRLEQAVIFLLFNEDLSQKDAAHMLNIYSKTVSKIKIRALNKLKKYLKGDIKNEE